MTTLELTDLIQQQLLENPVLEEVATQEEAQELAEKILDHLASADPASATADRHGLKPPSRSWAVLVPMAQVMQKACADLRRGRRGRRVRYRRLADLSEDSVGDEIVGEDGARAMRLKRSISDVSFRTTSIPVTKHRKWNTKKTRRRLNSF